MNPILKSFFDKKIPQIEKTLSEILPPDKTKIVESMNYSLLSPGKRIRPLLCLAAFEACGGKNENIIFAAASLELIHAFSLVHDDLPCMDNDDFRRGRPTNHKVYGEGMAVLAGDALITEAFFILSRLKGFSNQKILEVISDVAGSSGFLGMVGGQALDIEFEKKSALNEEELFNLHRLKTGKLISVSVTLGAKLATEDVQKISSLKAYGDSIGLAFQIADDILDEKEAKKASSIAVLGLDESKKRALKAVDDALKALSSFGNEADILREIAHFTVQRKL